MNYPQTIYVNPGRLKRMSGIHLYPANKKLFTISSISTLYELV